MPSSSNVVYHKVPCYLLLCTTMLLLVQALRFNELQLLGKKWFAAIRNGDSDNSKYNAYRSYIDRCGINRLVTAHTGFKGDL